MKLFVIRYTWLKLINIVVILVMFFGGGNQINSQNKSSEIVPRTYTANYTKEAIEIDGLGNEKSWENTSCSQDFIDVEGIKTPKYTTKFKMLWNETYIYVLAEMEEPHIWGNLKKRDTIIFHNNDFEIFIDPDGDTHNYYEFEFNALNTLWDLFLTKPYREDNVVLNDWDANGIQSAVHIDGTLNNPEDVDEKWTLEVAIPLAVFKTSYFETIDLEDNFWRINFSRVNWDFQLENGKYQRKKNNKGELEHEYNWVWSPQGIIAMHQPETWGYVYFSPKQSNNSKTFMIPEEEQVKWKLFELYRAQKTYYEQHKTWSKSIDVLNVETLVDNKTLEPVLEYHSTGWNISVTSPFSNNTLIIREDGKLISK